MKKKGGGTESDGKWQKYRGEGLIEKWKKWKIDVATLSGAAARTGKYKEIINRRL